MDIHKLKNVYVNILFSLTFVKVMVFKIVEECKDM
jgi:hypothetical protein